MAQQFSGLPMDSLIGAPLNAAAKGNASMAMTQTKFMLDTCFSKDENGDGYKPIMIDMYLERPVIDELSDTEAKFKTVQSRFNLPLLTVIPINSLGVDEVDINFEMEVKSSFAEDTEHKDETEMKAHTSFEAKMGWGAFSATVKGSASYDHKDSNTHSTHYQKSNSAKYALHVHAGQLPVPKGVNTIIEAFANSIQPLEVKHTDNTQGGEQG